MVWMPRPTASQCAIVVCVRTVTKRKSSDVPRGRFVAVKTEDQQARAMLFRTRQRFVGQRTQLINALRGRRAEHGLIAARGPAHLKRLVDALADNDTALAIETFAPDLATFKRGRDFAAWLALVPKQDSTGGKARLGKTSNRLGTMLRMTLPGNGWVCATSAPSRPLEQ